MEKEKVLRSAQELVEALQIKYREYTLHMRELEKRTTMLDTLKGWATGASPVVKDQANQAFYGEIEALAKELEFVLKDMNPDEGAPAAAMAVELILAPKPVSSKRASDWMLLAAEGLSIPLIPYLAREKAEELSRSYVKSTPKRLMLPKQKEVLQALQARM